MIMMTDADYEPSPNDVAVVAPGSRQPIHGLVLRPLTRSSACLHNAIMPNMLIRNVDARLHARLVEHAKADGQSLQQYLLTRLEAFAETLTAREAIERWEAGIPVRPESGTSPVADVVHDIHATREGRTERLTELASARRGSARRGDGEPRP
jgi:hypothetical protein